MRVTYLVVHEKLTSSFVGTDRANSSRWIQDRHIFSMDSGPTPQSMKASRRKVNAWFSISWVITSSLSSNFFSGSFNEKETKGGSEGFRSLKTVAKEEGVGRGCNINLESNARCFKWRSGGVGENRKSGIGESSGFYMRSVDGRTPGK
jgi:hypothetical protein